MITAVIVLFVAAEGAFGFLFGGTTGTDFRCTSFGGDCVQRHETCCPGGWTFNRTCHAPNWCCMLVTDCEKQGGKCTIPEEEYCPGGYDFSVSCGSIFGFTKCCLKNSPCETEYGGTCIPKDRNCKGTIVPSDGDNLCGEKDDEYDCCVRDPVGCTVGKRAPFCDFLSNTGLTILDTPSGTGPSANLNDQCTNGNAQLNAACGGGTTCLKPKIPAFLECIETACPNAQVISVTDDPNTYNGGTPQCRGKVVGVRVDLNDEPNTCDKVNFDKYCEEYKGDPYMEEQSPAVFVFHCVFLS